MATPAVRVAVLDGPGLEYDRTLLWHRLRVAGAMREPALQLEHVVCDDDERGFVAALNEASARNTAVIISPGSLANNRTVQVAAVETARTMPIAWLELVTDDAPRDEHLHPVRIYGRGIDGYRHALQSIAAQMAWPRQIVPYGPGAHQFASLRLPEGGGARPVVALLHGGGYRDIWALDRTESVAADLARRGYASWNIEFRRLGGSGTAWRDIFDDVGAALDKLVDLRASCELDLDRCVVLGHSSGGHLALWAGARQRLETDQPGASPQVVPALVIALAGLGEVVEFSRRKLDFDITTELLGGAPDEVPERYAATSPRSLLPTGIPQLLVHGTEESFRDINDLGRVYRDAAIGAGDVVDYVELSGTGHPDLIDPGSAAWQWTAAQLEHRVPPSD